MSFKTFYGFIEAALSADKILTEEEMINVREEYIKRIEFAYQEGISSEFEELKKYRRQLTEAFLFSLHKHVSPSISIEDVSFNGILVFTHQLIKQGVRMKEAPFESQNAKASQNEIRNQFNGKHLFKKKEKLD